MAGSRCRWPNREPHDRAAIPGALGGHRAAVCLGHLLNDREAEARPGHAPRRGRAVEALEDVREVRSAIPGPWSRTISSWPGEANVDPAHRPGSTSRRCRADSRSRARGSREHRRPLSAPAAPRSEPRDGSGRAPDRFLRDEVEPHLLERAAAAPRRARARSARRSSAVISPSCSDHVAEAVACDRRQGARRPSASTSMFVRRLVSGVRSSCEAS